MVVLKPFDDAGWAGVSGSFRVWFGRVSTVTVGGVGRRFISYGVYSHVQWREVDVEEGGIVAVLTFYVVHKLGNE